MVKIIGILGGMGPMATCDLMKNIISFTDAKTDQDYPRMLIDCNTSIPDRTKAILYGMKSPISCMKESVDKLKQMGADFVVVPCNTAHFYVDYLERECDIPFVNMVEETIKEVKSCNFKKVGLLATEGTIKSGIYVDLLRRNNIECILPTKEEQTEIMRVIYEEIKRNVYLCNPESLVRIVSRFKAEGAESVVLGCTEIPLVLNDDNSPIMTIVPTKILARKAVEMAGYKLIDRKVAR